MFARISNVGTAALALWLLAVPVGAQPVYPELTGPVVDAAGLLDPADEAALAGLLERHLALTGARVIVATVPDLGGRSIELYGANLAHEWNIATYPNSAILIVADAERRVRLEFGPPVKGTMTDVRSSQMVQRVIVPAFRAGAFRIGLEEGLAELFRMLEEGAEAARLSDEERHLSNLLVDKRVLVPLALMVLVVAYCALGRGRCRKKQTE